MFARCVSFRENSKVSKVHSIPTHFVEGIVFPLLSGTSGDDLVESLLWPA